MPPTVTQETTNVLIDHRIQHLEKVVQDLLNERDKALRWGILTLGTAVLAMGTLIFKFIMQHIKI